MTRDDRPAPKGRWPNGQGKKSRYDLMETLDIFKSYGLTRKDLGQALYDGKLRAFGFPYSEDKTQKRSIDFEPDDFKKRWRDNWALPVKDNYMGDTYLGDEPYTGEDDTEEPPAHIFPHAVESERGIRNERKELIVTEAVVYISNDALEEFFARQFPEEAESGAEATNGEDSDEHVEADSKDEGLEAQPKAPESQQAAEIEPVAEAEARGVDLPPSQPRRQGKYSKAHLDAWYKEHVRHHQGAGLIPSRQDDLNAARKKFSNSVIPRDAVRDARQRLAPDTWKQKGLRKTGG